MKLHELILRVWVKSHHPKITLSMVDKFLEEIENKDENKASSEDYSKIVDFL